MKHRFTSLLSSIPGPRQETIIALQLLARLYSPAEIEQSEHRWFDEHTLTSKAV